MNSNLLIYSSKLALLCLLPGLVASAITPAKADNLIPKLPEQQVDNQSDRSPINTAFAEAEFIADKNEPILLSQALLKV